MTVDSRVNNTHNNPNGNDVAVWATWHFPNKSGSGASYSKSTFHLSLSPPPNMARPSRKHASRLFASLSFASLLFIALICLCPPSVSAEDKKSEYGTVIGIDLGTTYSCVAVQRAGRVEIIANDQGHRITPSWVAFTDEERLIGDSAKNAFHTNPTNTVFDAKRLIGRKIQEPELQRDIKHWWVSPLLSVSVELELGSHLRPFKVVDKSGKPAVHVKHRGEQREFVSYHWVLVSPLVTHFYPVPRGNFCNGSWKDEGDR